MPVKRSDTLTYPAGLDVNFGRHDCEGSCILVNKEYSFAKNLKPVKICSFRQRPSGRKFATERKKMYPVHHATFVQYR